MNQYWLTYIDAKNTIVFVIMKMKQYYNDKHEAKFF